MSTCDSCVGTEADHHLCDGCAQEDIARETALIAEVERLKAALEKHGGHSYICKRQSAYNTACVCGFSAALDSSTPAPRTFTEEQVRTLLKEAWRYGWDRSRVLEVGTMNDDLKALLEGK